MSDSSPWLRQQRQKERDEYGVACKVCGAKFFELRSHLQHKHGMSVPQYQERFPKAPLVCKRRQGLGGSYKKVFDCSQVADLDELERTKG